MDAMDRLLQILEARERRRVRVQAARLTSIDHFTDTEGYLWVKRDVVAASLFDPNTRTFPNAWDVNQLKTKQQAVTYDEDAVGLAEDATFIAPGRIEVLQIFAEGAMSAVVANRNISVLIAHVAAQIGVLPWNLMETSAILLTADQNGSIFFPGRSDTTWTNDNTVIAAVADENIVPLFLEDGDFIICQSDNDQIGDVLGVTVWYRTAE